MADYENQVSPQLVELRKIRLKLSVLICLVLDNNCIDFSETLATCCTCCLTDVSGQNHSFHCNFNIISKNVIKTGYSAQKKMLERSHIP